MINNGKKEINEAIIGARSMIEYLLCEEIKSNKNENISFIDNVAH
jgi:hypothetical protein